MAVYEVLGDKRRYRALLLLADEQESMIDRYLDRGRLYVLAENGVKAICVVTDEGNGMLEIKNMATVPTHQRRGYGRRLMAFLHCRYGGRYTTIRAGTGGSPLTVPFYEKCGFRRAYLVRNFFPEHYDHPIYEAGRRLVDMVYLTRELPAEPFRPLLSGRPVWLRRPFGKEQKP